ncbi:MAG: hypothetical protein ACOH2H_07045 [Cypionkella sp.]
MELLTLAEHRQIIDSIEKGDPDLAARMNVDHLKRARCLYHQDNFTQRK